MIVAITGGTGFIGRRLVEAHLARGDTIRILTRDSTRAHWLRDRAEIVVGDLASAPLARFVAGCDVLYHCAAELGRPELMRAVNVLGTRSLVAAAGGVVRRWVQLSSVGVYGPVRDGLVDESWPLAPRGRYEETKAEADHVVEEAFRSGAFGATFLRPSIVFGPDMPNRSLYQLVSMVSRGLFFFTGPPNASANYIYVDNVVDALVACGTHPAARGAVYNLSDYRTIEQFVGTLAVCLEKPVPRLRLPEAPIRVLARVLGKLPGFPLPESRVDALTTRARYSSERIERELGYRHRVPMEDGLRQLVQSWRTGS
ncbi:MAG: NAD-dependent epimerase/dehydratase family protein [Betaproteobacteria bacterium]|nr:NAD-dependent epimerase/dehydratase family protein [Betaproteobacteria bacterium]